MVALSYASQEAVYRSDFTSELSVSLLSSVEMNGDNHGNCETSRYNRIIIEDEARLYQIHVSKRVRGSKQNHTFTREENGSTCDIFTKFVDNPKFKLILDKIVNFESWTTIKDAINKTINLSEKPNDTNNIIVFKGRQYQGAPISQLTLSCCVRRILSGFCVFGSPSSIAMQTDVLDDL